MRFRRRFSVENQRGFTLMELMIVIAVISVITMISLPIYTNMLARARVGKAQADLRGLVSTIAAFGAHCGDIPATVAWTNAAPLAAAGGNATCSAAVGGNLGTLSQIVTDAASIPAGPFYTQLPVPPVGWQYTYTRTGVTTFTLSGTNPQDLPNPGIVLP